MQATYTKLRSGEWGVRVLGSARDGQTVGVVKKSGERKTETIARVLWSGRDSRTGEQVALCAIRRASSSLGSRHRAGDYECRACGHAGDDCADMDCTCRECGGMMR
jgi:hypothetical protein